MLKHGSCVCTPVTEVLPERLAWSVVNNHGSLCIIVQVGKLPLLSLLSLTQGGKSSQICKKKKYFWAVFLFLDVFLIYFSIMLRSSVAIETGIYFILHVGFLCSFSAVPSVCNLV